VPGHPQQAHAGDGEEDGVLIRATRGPCSAGRRFVVYGPVGRPVGRRVP
jgi:hypothetical protein